MDKQTSDLINKFVGEVQILSDEEKIHFFRLGIPDNLHCVVATRLQRFSRLAKQLFAVRVEPYVTDVRLHDWSQSISIGFGFHGMNRELYRFEKAFHVDEIRNDELFDMAVRGIFMKIYSNQIDKAFGLKPNL